MESGGRHSVVVCVGSNAPDRERRISEACSMLAAILSDCRFSRTMESRDSSGHTDSRYANRLCAGWCDCPGYGALNEALKGYERDCGRADVAGEVAIDLDIVIFDGEIVRKGTFDTPYFQYLYADLA
ncbi:MAG: 2-amino-4-hydroxy-6-hydroxymethyldihydropteridine diphosphokinase [[Clostridium] fimetarium]|nr:2-amino-4-hydroxy-6-hydroxymethyldihydropteridine diphosphokinase [Alistipes timonensis]MCM1405229.1 2-amino-4-hydroxy-6-hydroxymethyldihydropteridine diphosphokinase [[Clostridium] fimetarium]